MAKNKKNEAIESEEIKHKEVLRSITIQGADGNAYRFRLWAPSSEIPRYELDITGIGDDLNDCGFEVDPYSLQKLTAWFAKAVRRVSKSDAIRSVQIQPAVEKTYVFALWADSSEIPRYELDITALANPDDGIGFVVDLHGVQKLTAWFAEAALRASEDAADHSHS